MSVTTAQTYGGQTVVYIEYGSQRMSFQFTTRHDAAMFLQSLRKRVR